MLKFAVTIPVVLLRLELVAVMVVAPVRVSVTLVGGFAAGGGAGL